MVSVLLPKCTTWRRPIYIWVESWAAFMKYLCTFMSDIYVINDLLAVFSLPCATRNPWQPIYMLFFTQLAIHLYPIFECPDATIFQYSNVLMPMSMPQCSNTSILQKCPILQCSYHMSERTHVPSWPWLQGSESWIHVLVISFQILCWSSSFDLLV